MNHMTDTVQRRDPGEQPDPDTVTGDEIGDGTHGEDAMGETLDGTDPATARVDAAAITIESEQGSW